MKPQPVINSKLIFAFLTATLFATGCATNQEMTQPSSSSTEAPTMLTGEEIKSLISGRTGEGRTSEGYYIKAYNSTDGKISATSEKAGKTYHSSGTWEIQGNTVCAQWDNKDWKSACSTFARIGDRYLIKPTVSGVPSIPATKYVDGNPYDL